jgi:hypothetical protein
MPRAGEEVQGLDDIGEVPPPKPGLVQQREDAVGRFKAAPLEGHPDRPAAGLVRWRVVHAYSLAAPTKVRLQPDFSARMRDRM